MDAILIRRAEALAVKIAEPPADAFDALVFTIGQEQYALPNEHVVEVRPANSITALGGAPAFVAGLTNTRGKIVPVLDLRPLFGIPPAAAGPRAVVLMVSPRGSVGLLVNGQPAVRQLRSTELGPLPAGSPKGLDAAFVRGVTPELIVVLDGPRLLADPRIVVKDGQP